MNDADTPHRRAGTSTVTLVLLILGSFCATLYCILITTASHQGVYEGRRASSAVLHSGNRPAANTAQQAETAPDSTEATGKDEVPMVSSSSVALCITGQPRSFMQPRVWQSIRSDIVGALRTPVDVFMYIVRPAPGSLVYPVCLSWY